MGGGRDREGVMELRAKAVGDRRDVGGAASSDPGMRGLGEQQTLVQNTEETPRWKYGRKKPLLRPVLTMQYKRTEGMLWRPNVPCLTLLKKETRANGLRII